MNEVTHIHIGRQPFTASVDAHKSLKAYITAIQDQVKDQDVVEEVELRIAELLAERGITGDKVILIQDVDYIKQQLGSPNDFSESSGQAPDVSEKPPASKQLFRDTDSAMVAGVSAGLAAYSGIDVVLIRLFFAIATIAGGWGLLLYIVLWLIVPPAKTGSDRLIMRGETVTLNSLKEAVRRADAKGAATRAGNTIAPVINTIFRIVLKTIGIVFIIGGLCTLFGLIAVRVYMAAHNGQLFQENLFPVGRTEHLLTDLVFILVGLLAVLDIISGLAIYKRRWPVRNWVTGVLVGVFLVGLATAGAFSIDTVHNVRDRYLSRTHTTTRLVQPFQNVSFVGDDIDYRWDYAPTYAVSFQYFDNPNVSKIKTTVSNNLLQIDTTNYSRERHCTMLCVFPSYNLLVIVKGPQPPPTDSPATPSMPKMPVQP